MIHIIKLQLNSKYNTTNRIPGNNSLLFCYFQNTGNIVRPFGLVMKRDEYYMPLNVFKVVFMYLFVFKVFCAKFQLFTH